LCLVFLSKIDWLRHKRTSSIGEGLRTETFSAFNASIFVNVMMNIGRANQATYLGWTP
jgi:hypothetical protein